MQLALLYRQCPLPDSTEGTGGPCCSVRLVILAEAMVWNRQPNSAIWALDALHQIPAGRYVVSSATR